MGEYVTYGALPTPGVEEFLKMLLFWVVQNVLGTMAIT
jgi:hypothetical protein